MIRRGLRLLADLKHDDNKKRDKISEVVVISETISTLLIVFLVISLLPFYTNALQQFYL